MSYTKVKAYRDDELLDHAKKINGFNGFPKEIWIYGVRSNEDTYNIFDDKFYVFDHDRFMGEIGVLTGTTNTGGYGFFNFWKWNKKGVGHIKANEWYYDCWIFGRHKNKVDALVQRGGELKIIRDGNKDKKVDDGDYSVVKWGGFNFHPNTYNLWTKVKNWTINGWSVGCQVPNDIPKYKKLIDTIKVREQKKFTYLLVEEF